MSANTCLTRVNSTSRRAMSPEGRTRLDMAFRARRAGFVCDACGRHYTAIPARLHDGPNEGPVCTGCWDAFCEDNG